MFTVLRAFIPNEQSWVFHWIFSVVFPRMFNLNTLNRIKLIISDGDNQETRQIDDCRARCGWHIVEMGWTKHILGANCFPPNEANYYNSICSHIKAWIYSWMKPDCETQQEYEISKALLIQFVQSQPIKDRLGDLFAKSFLLFFRKHIEILEGHFLFYT